MSNVFIVKEAVTEDLGANKVWLTPRSLKKMGLSPGDIISIEGDRPSCGIVFPGNGKGDDGQIRLNRETRRNCNVSIGGKVLVEKVRAHVCISCTLSPWTAKERAETILSLDLAGFIGKKLFKRPLSKGDVLTVHGIAITGGGLPFRVEHVKPKGIVRIDNNTNIELVLPRQGDEIIDMGKKVGYEDIGGLANQLAGIREMVELPLNRPQIFSTMGITPPKGLLLYGPPGTGKTLISKALAQETGANIFTIRGPEIMDRLYGKSEKNLRDVFSEAVKGAPSIIFIDEIDSIAPRRDGSSGDVEKRIVAQLLTSMDSLPEDCNVVVIGTTNRPDAIEEALRRPGRFDREIELPAPDEKGRGEILTIHTRGMPLDDTVDLDSIIYQTTGYVGADLQALCREAALSAIKRHIDGKAHLGDVPIDGLLNLNVGMQDFRSAVKKIMPSALREITVRIPECTFQDIGGLEKVKRDISECVEKPFSHRADFRRLGIRTPNGVLLYGPPGSGKTLLARAVANQAGSAFIPVKGPEILSRYVGEAEKRLRDIFKRGRQVSPCIIFFDEVDSVTRSRDTGSGKQHGLENLTNQLLTLIDGIEKYENVIVIGATNRPEVMDEAFLRKGRFDRLIYVPPPDKDERFSILGIHTKRIPLASDVDLSYLAENTKNFSGADIEGLCQEAAIEAFREDPSASVVGANHFQNALLRLKPSISKETIKYYNTINKRLSGRVTSGDVDVHPYGYG